MHTSSNDIERSLVIVGSGFIASELARTAQKEWGWPVEVLFRNYQNPTLKGVPNRPMPSNINELISLLDSIRPTDVVIAAGSSFVPEINLNVQKSLEQHLNITLMILDALTRLKHPLLGRVLVIGSASEYGEFHKSPVDEEHPTLPCDHYGLIKLSLRHLGLYYYEAHNLPVVHLRQFNVTGPTQNNRFVLPSICHQIAKGMETFNDGQTVHIVAGNTAVQRDFLAISDVCQAYRTLMLRGFPGEAYNICSGQAHPISELISTAAEIAGVSVNVKIDSHLVRQNDKVQPIICGDPTKLRSLGWRPKLSIRNLLEQIIEAHKSVANNDAVQGSKRD